jgi:DNA-binding XRE family transcriptional regulator
MGNTSSRRRQKGPFTSLKAFFEQTGTRQADIAVDAGISITHMCNIVNGKRHPSLDLAVRLSQLTNVPVEAFSSRAA